MFSKTLAALALTLAFAVPAIAASLDGIGLAKAEAIVAYRKTHGDFKSANDLGAIKGIGDKTLARNHDAIRLSGSFAAPAPKPARHPRKK